MSRKLVLILVFLMLLVCLGYPIFQQNGVRASDGFPVHNLNTGLNYTSIQEAVNANETLDGDVIHVDAGTYIVNDTVYNWINKSVSVVGDGMENTTIINTYAPAPVFTVLSDHVTISGFTLRNGTQGVYGVSNYVHVTRCNISDNFVGVEIDSGSVHLQTGEIIEGNILMSNTQLAMTLFISNSTVCRNIISDNGGGIYLSPGYQELPTGNLVYENTITNSSQVQPHRAACSVGGYNNTIFLNNFLDTTVQAYPGAANAWNCSLSPDDLLWGGNFWSDYNETNKYGMGFAPYVIDSNNIDHYPLTGMVNIFDASYGYEVAVVSNSSISDFEFNVTNQSQAALTFRVAGENGTAGFCWVIIPQALINYSQTWAVKLDGELWSTHEYSVVSNQTHWNFWIDYSHSVHQIEIAGVTAIPELPTLLILGLLMMATLLAIIVYKGRRLT